MAEALYDFGPLDELKPEAIGLPGSRRFRVVFREGQRTACFWMEKEQLGGLADTIHEMLAQDERGLGKTGQDLTGSYPEPFTVEAQSGRIALGYNDLADLFILYFFDAEQERALIEKATSEEEAERLVQNLTASLRIEASRQQLERFYRDCAEIINSGRVRHSRNGHIPHQE
jgi:hypothetical protein